VEKKFDLKRLLTDLVDADIRFIIVGGVAAVLQGVPTTTFDLDIVHERSSENVTRIVAFLERVSARARGRLERPYIVPGVDALSGPGHQLLQTRHGALDFLGAIEGGQGYEELEDFAVSMTLDGREFRVLGLDKLLELKKGSTHPKDCNTRLLLEEALRRRGSEQN